MSNPFDDRSGSFSVLVNDEDEYSLWPAAVDVPPGWRVARPAGTLDAARQHVDEVWTDLRPRSLAEASDRTPVPAAGVTGTDAR